MEMQKVEGLALYQTQGCGYCVRVRRFVEEAGWSIELRDLYSNSEYAEELISATGRRTVPCLRIERSPGEFEWLHESADIIDYLSARFAES
jgi:glutaredoxin